MSSTATLYNETPSAVNPLIVDGCLHKTSQEPPLRRIGVVACCKSKLPSPAPAYDLYQSPLFRHARQYVERECDDWVILSARYGVVLPETILRPYDRTLATMLKCQRVAWALRCRIELRLLFPDYANLVFIPLCGYLYRGALDGLRCEPPYQGLGIGQQLQFLIRANAAASRQQKGEVRP